MSRAYASDGTTLRYDVRGSGPFDLLFLHGMGSSDTWRPLLGALDFDKVRAVTCDRCGHGRSESGTNIFAKLGVESRAAAMLRVLETNG